MFHLTTFFDKNYLPRGLVLYDTLKEHVAEFELYILCIDEFTLNYFQSNSSSYPEVRTLSLTEIEQNDPELASCKKDRSRIEYYFTLSPCLPLYLLKKYNLPHVCSLDADIMFLASPQPLFDYLKSYSIVITPHKFADELKFFEHHGIYNVSFQIFKNNDIGIACLQKWREQCIEWCHDYLDHEDNRYADQKYLDSWNELYPGQVKSLNDSVSGLAPWNVSKYHLTLKDGKFFSNNERLVFYHFHDFKLLAQNWASNGFTMYKVKESSGLKQLYLKYWNNLSDRNEVLSIMEDVSQRIDLSNTLSVKLSNANRVYFNLLGVRLFSVEYSKLNVIIKEVISKIYG